MIYTIKARPYLFLIFFLMIQSAIAQQDDEIVGRHCGTFEYNSMLMAKHPEFKTMKKAIEMEIPGEVKNKTLGSVDSLYTIPVIMHVVWHTNSENVLNQQIESQLDVLNEDYSGTNLDIVNVPEPFRPVKAGDVKLRFCLATLDPNNQPTNGVIRTHTDQELFNFFDDVKSSSKGGDDAWPANKYLNIWICNLSGSLLGYAQYPGGPDSTDGVVIFYKAFGRNGTAVKPYNKGRTLTHEVGHWLNLYHTWGDDGGGCTGSDKVSDTPNQDTATYKCESFPHITCGNDPYGDMFMNYLDYTEDACMCLFTAGQKTRMRNALDNFRDAIKSSKQTDCTPLDPKPEYTTSIIPNPNNGNFIIHFKKTVPGSFTIGLYDLLGQQVFADKLSGIENGIENRNIRVECNFLNRGIYFLRIEVEGHTYNNKILVFK